MAIIEVDSIFTQFGPNVIHDRISFDINEGQIYGLLGGSGTGKSTLLRQMIMLQKIQSGNINVLGKSVNNLSFDEANAIKQNWGVLFQFGALFSSISVLENVKTPLREYTSISDPVMEEIAFTKLKMVGLPDKAAYLYPSELSGGMKKRVALARALAIDPKLLFLDEPTSGLDPASAEAFNRLILELRDMLGLTVVMVTHDLDTIRDALDRFIILFNKKIILEGNYEDALKSDHYFIKEFLKI
jgi:phospholipid/cholesterol/gamma-HCH transport system ATP-binding protein